MAKKDKEQCFVFYERWYVQLQRLPPDERLQMYEAICKYAFGIKTEDMAYYLESLMDDIRLSLDSEKNKKEDISKKRSNAIKRRWQKNSVQMNTNEYNCIQVNENEYNCIQPNTTEYKRNEKETEKETSPHTPYKEKEKEKEKKDLEVEVVVENTREENFETENDVGRLQNYINEIKQDRSWQEIVCMKYHISLSKLAQLFSGFMIDCQIQGTVKHENLDAVRYHFANWLRIQLEQENKKKNDANKNNKNTKRRGYGVTATSAADYSERL